jgi:hypothetical protein
MFAWGDVGSNDCPPKYFKIGDSTLCRNAMATVDSKLGFFSLVSVPRSDWPGGCARGSYTGNEFQGDDGFLWNPLSAGAASPGKQLLCIGMHASPHGRPAGVCSAQLAAAVLLCGRARAHL